MLKFDIQNRKKFYVMRRLAIQLGFIYILMGSMVPMFGACVLGFIVSTARRQEKGIVLYKGKDFTVQSFLGITFLALLVMFLIHTCSLCLMYADELFV